MEKLALLKGSLYEAQKTKNKEKQIEVLLEIANYNYDLKKFEITKRTLKQIFELDSKKTDVNYLYALVLLNENSDEEAKIYLKKEIKLNPAHDKAKKILSKIEISTNYPIVTIITTIIFIGLFYYFSNNYSLNYSTYLKYSLSVFNQNIFSAITSIFLHVNLVHLIFNTSIFLIFGLYLEKYMGSIRFATLILLSGVVGNYAQSFLTPENFVIGASASIFGILGAIVMTEPLLKTKLLGFINVPIIFILGIIFALEGVMNEYILGFVSMGDYAHIFGFLSGVLLTSFFYYNTISNFYNWLGMAFGFWIIISTIKGIITIHDFESIVSFVVTTLVGIFLIIYSYIKLKYKHGSVIENESNV